jgi:predicted  nucleic acid-binding Zn ribbon protein
MKVHPFSEVAMRVEEILTGTSTGENFLAFKMVAGPNAKVEVYQQFNCAACGTKQTMDQPNTLFTHGKCEECGAVSDLKRDGCNYAVHYSRQ